MDKRIFATILMTACSTAVLWADNVKLNPGGINEVDFFRVTREREAAAKSGGESILPKSRYFWNFSGGANRGSVPGGWNAQWGQKEAQMKKLLKNSVRKEDGVFIYTMETPETINKFRNERSQPIFHQRLMPVQNIDVKPGKKYEITYKLRGECPVSGSNRFVLTVDYMNSANRYIKGVRSSYFSVAPTAGWQTQVNSVHIPEGVSRLRIHYGLTNLGKVEFTTGTVVEKDVLDGYEMKLFPMGMLDNEYHLSADRVNFIGFTPRNESGRKAVNPRLLVTLPKEIKMLGLANYMSKNDYAEKVNPDGSTTYTVNVNVYHWEKTIKKDFGGSFPVQLSITNNVPASDKLYKITYQAIDENYAAPVQEAHLKIIPAITGEQPRIFQSGVYDSRSIAPEKEVFQRFAKEYRNAGFNTFYNFRCAKYMTDAMHAENITTAVGSWNIHNGFGSGGAASSRPAYTHFIGLDGKPAADYSGRLQLNCPTTVIYRTEYYKNVILKEIRDSINDRDYFMSNWEPSHAQTSNGCYCMNCQKEFIAYSKLPADEVKAAWPKEIMSKYRSEWLTFKSYMHGRYLATYEEDVDAIAKAAGRKGSFFMPMITRDIVLDSQFNLTDVNAFAVRFYADKIKWINPWGPYLGYHWSKLKRDLPGSRIRMLTMARSVVRYMEKVVADPAKRPKLLAFPLGLCVNMLVAPEQLQMDTLSVYVGGWHGSMPYYFPSNYDARYWRNLAEANTLIARTEKYIMEGKKLSQPAVDILTPYPAPLYAEINNPGQPISSLQVDLFAKGGNRLLAAGNFWEYGEVFFSVKVPGLKPGQSYRVYNVLDNNVFAKDNGQYFTGKDLANGVKLHAGGMRWVFYAIEEVNSKALSAADRGKFIRQREVSQTMQSRLAKLTKAFEEEKAFVNSQSKPVESPSKTDMLDSFKAPGVTITKRIIPAPKVSLERVGAYDTAASGGEKDRTEITVKCGSSTWVIDPDRGAYIRSWKFNGKELSNNRTTLGMGLPTAWIPGSRWNRPFNVTKVERIPGGAAIEFSRTLNLNDSKLLDGIPVVQRMEFTADKCHLSTCIRNAYNDTVRFSFRYQNLPGLMQPLPGQTPGKVTFSGEKGPMEVVPTGRHRMFRMKSVAEDKEINKVLFGERPNPVELITGANSVYTSADGTTQLKMTILPEVDFHGYASFAGGSELTFEPIFNTRELPVGQSWQAEMILEAVKK
ncbi:MAG: hypothetical protein E7052_08260 [Lentisphaerae bacterium]|nr:hypothetical protein [Lentisphaerota bacterium]